MMTVQHIDAIRDQIKNEMSSSSANLQQVNQLLTQAKVPVDIYIKKSTSNVSCSWY